MKLSVIILNYNVRYFLELCLKSVHAAVKDIDAEIIVVDNNSTDDSCAMIKRLFPEVKLIENTENYGFSKGNNIGVQHAKGEYLCILNPDTVVAEDTFTSILNFAESKPNCGIVGCQLIDGRGEFLPESKRQIPTPIVAFQKLLGKSNNYYSNHIKPENIGETDIFVGAFMIMKRALYLEVHGFDEDYFMYGEDIDLSYKILKAGYQNYYYGKNTIIHFKGESTLKDQTYAKRFYGAMGIFYKKHFKSNWLLTGLVKLALNFATRMTKTKDVDNVEIAETMVISNAINKDLKPKLKRPITFTSNTEEPVPENAQIVIDIEYVSFKSIIEIMKRYNSTRQNSYRMLLKSSSFMLGSDNSVSRGEVIHL